MLLCGRLPSWYISVCGRVLGHHGITYMYQSVVHASTILCAPEYPHGTSLWCTRVPSWYCISLWCTCATCTSLWCTCAICTSLWCASSLHLVQHRPTTRPPAFPKPGKITVVSFLRLFCQFLASSLGLSFNLGFSVCFSSILSFGPAAFLVKI